MLKQHLTQMPRLPDLPEFHLRGWFGEEVAGSKAGHAGSYFQYSVAIPEECLLNISTGDLSS